MWTEKLLAAIAIPVVVAASVPVAAQAFPHKPVRVIIPYPPGGGIDSMARFMAPNLGEQLGQSVIIDNRGGGNSTIGTGLVAQSAPDGYTLLLVDAALLINPSLFPKLPYDTLKDFAPVIFAGGGAMILVVHPTVPARSVKELVALAKQRPGQLSYGFAGFGSTGHMASEMLKLAAGIDMLQVPYKGAGPALAGALGGHVSMTFVAAAAGKGPIGAGQMIALALSSVRRLDSFPQVPTFAEVGYPDVNNVRLMFGVYAPAGTPKEIVGRLNAAFNQTLQTPESRLRFAEMGLVTGGGTPEAWAAEVRTSIARWAQFVKQANIKME